jgi:hypothetical protein
MLFRMLAGAAASPLLKFLPKPKGEPIKDYGKEYIPWKPPAYPPEFHPMAISFVDRMPVWMPVYPQSVPREKA